MTFLSKEANLNTVYNLLKGNYTLCLVANLVELAEIEIHDHPKEIYLSHFTFAVTNMLRSCQRYVAAKQSNTTCWHPILGWFEQPEDNYLQEALPAVKIQLSYLWTGNIITVLMCRPLNELADKEYLLQLDLKAAPINRNILYRTFIENRRKRNNHCKYYRKLSCSETKRIALICSLYYTTLYTLREIKSSIFTALCYKDKKILYNLWLFFGTIGPNYGLKAFLDYLSSCSEYTSISSPEIQMLILFCDCMTHYLTTLDDIEMYEQQDPFKLSDFTCMSYFLNQFLYKSVINNLFGEYSTT